MKQPSTLIPAAPGYYVAERSDRTTLPIIAWKLKRNHEGGYDQEPVVVGDALDPEIRHYVLTPDGFVVELGGFGIWTSLQEWRLADYLGRYRDWLKHFAKYGIVPPRLPDGVDASDVEAEIWPDHVPDGIGPDTEVER